VSSASATRPEACAACGPTRLTTSDGVPVALYDLGGEGSPLLFVHAAGLHGRVFRPLAGHLRTRFHSWAIDLRGHGDSGLPPQGLTGWHEFHRDVVAAVDHLGGHVTAVGHSMGGAALLMAVAARPAAFRALFFCEPAIIHRDEALPGEVMQTQARLVEITRRRRATFPSRAAALENLCRKPPTSQLNAAALAAYVEHGFADDGGAVRLKCPPEFEAIVFALSAEQDPEPGYRAVSCPSFVAFGSATDAMQKRSAAAVAARMGVTPIEVEGQGHFAPLENPARFADLLATTLADALPEGMVTSMPA
jgi:pimeloyl-ACP methyl ester carboxylesterase